ncbi:MAG: hypothetical protein IMF12_04020, partial [Proteobacteria bacterium]|nr:hypothetical protein [Pseudomonadota bacterium]
ATAFDEYTDQTTRVTEINKINVKLVKDVMDQSGLIIKKSLFEKLLDKTKRN